MRQRIHNTLIVVDRYLRLMGDKTIPDSAEPRLESFYPPFVAGIDLPHQDVVDSYNPPFVARIDLPHQGVVDSYHLVAKARQESLVAQEKDLKLRNQLFSEETFVEWAFNIQLAFSPNTSWNIN